MLSSKLVDSVSFLSAAQVDNLVILSKIAGYRNESDRNVICAVEIRPKSVDKLEIPFPKL